MKLTDTKCRNEKPGDKAKKLSDGGGLYLHVQTNGSKYWRLKYRYLKKEKLLALGVYPTVSLAMARELRDEAKRKLAEGVDPSEHMKAEKRRKLAEAENSFKVVATEWHDIQKSRWTENHAGYTLRRLETNVFPFIGNKAITDIEPPEMLAVLRRIEERGACEMAGRVKSICSQVFRYAIASGKAARDPCQDLQGALKPYKKSHFSAIDSSEIPEFLDALNRNDARLYKHTQLAVKMLMLTFVRTSEMIQAKWDEFDLSEKTWIIPAERMKMSKSHIVPLSSQVIDILNDLRELSPSSPYIFPSQLGHKKHMSNNTVLKALERLGYKGRMTGHGFRALAMSTIKEKLGYRHEVVDRQLAHVPRSKVDRAYDRAQFLDERRKMMQEWADYLEGLS
ncbi:MAG: tyrosine-type recombinase/integrase [Alphaproteobacteria bacterium]|nr:tyrosine-type recombinase/integrase [Alphaproteobacteria bacterium]